METPRILVPNCVSAVLKCLTWRENARFPLLQQQQAWATDDVAQIYDKCIADLEQHLHAITPTLAMNPLTQALRSLLEAVVLARNSRDGIAALGLLQKVGHFRGGGQVLVLLGQFVTGSLCSSRLWKVFWMLQVGLMQTCCSATGNATCWS